MRSFSPNTVSATYNKQLNAYGTLNGSNEFMMPGKIQDLAEFNGEPERHYFLQHIHNLHTTVITLKITKGFKKV